MGDLADGFGVFDTALDIVDLGEVALKMATGGGDVLTPGAEKVLGPINAVIDGAKIGWGGAKAIDGFVNDDYSPEAWDGLNTAIDGTLGAAGNLPGPAGAVAKAAGAGYTVGNWLAPYVYGEEPTGAHTEAIPEDGIFKPTTGNKTVDWLFGVD